MPCKSDYLEPTTRETELRRAATLLIWLNAQLGHDSPVELFEAANDMYCSTDYVPQLCEAVTALGEEGRDRVIYSQAKIRLARDLANWWEAHQAADRLRQCAEADAELRRRTLASLTPEQKRVLGIRE